MSISFRGKINLFLAAIMAFLGYSCHAKKKVAESNIDNKEDHEERLLMYGPPQYFDKSNQTIDNAEPDVRVKKYGPPPVRR